MKSMDLDSNQKVMLTHMIVDLSRMILKYGEDDQELSIIMSRAACLLCYLFDEHKEDFFKHCTEFHNGVGNIALQTLFSVADRVMEHRSNISRCDEEKKLKETDETK